MTGPFEDPMTRKFSHQNDGASLIYNERARQITQEGYTKEHDRGHAEQLTDAAVGYAAFSSVVLGAPKDERESITAIGMGYGPPPMWPWHPQYWKPSEDLIKNLVRAGALIAAAIDSLLAEGEEPDIEPLFEVESTHPLTEPTGLEDAVLSPEALMVKAITGDTEARDEIRALAERAGITISFSLEELQSQMRANGMDDEAIEQAMDWHRRHSETEEGETDAPGV